MDKHVDKSFKKRYPVEQLKHTIEDSLQDAQGYVQDLHSA